MFTALARTHVKAGNKSSGEFIELVVVWFGGIPLAPMPVNATPLLSPITLIVLSAHFWHTYWFDNDPDANT
jgi:hypothetical protein